MALRDAAAPGKPLTALHTNLSLSRCQASPPHLSAVQPASPHHAHVTDATNKPSSTVHATFVAITPFPPALPPSPQHGPALTLCSVLRQVGLPQLEHRRLIFKRFVAAAARELAALRGHPAAATPPDGDDPDGLERLSEWVDPALLAERPCAARPLPPAQLQHISTALRAVLPPSVRHLCHAV